MEYNERIKNLRIQKNISQQQFADAVGVSRQSVARWENGWNVPTLFYAKKIAEYFGVSLEYLMSGAEENSAPKPSTEISAPPDLVAPTMWFSVLTFLPVALYFIFFVSNSLHLSGVNLRAVDGLSASLSLTLFVLLAAWWIVRLVDCFRKTSDKFLRYRLFTVWNFGLIFLIMNFITFAVTYNIGFPLPLLYCGSAFMAVAVDFIIVAIIRRALRSKMIGAPNAKINLVNLIYTVIAAVATVVLWAWIIYAEIAFYPTSGLEIGFAVLYFLCASVLIDLSYLIVRIVLFKKLRKECSEE